MNENQKNTMQIIPNYEKLTDEEKMFIVTIINTIIAQKEHKQKD